MFDILGKFYFPPVIRHDQHTQKSYLFVGDRWSAMGDIEYFYQPDSAKTGTIYMKIPDPILYAQEHAEEGAYDWLQWGPRVN